ncbi:bifunctional 2-polyprenyl-6-hydroxyphenol methylase/3-demethylubiquinol 3-O-methyltransferase UbiG [Pedobacter sp. Hv1]|uniref:class I SAM-dependent methyltransferase n=1 Tax=Pedobacter sp. Hv1 TaxID=1740090 RepID=UPI0006D8D3F8|nr:methyltransferase domain-containing protein [Pedobacter sp. Hv1]KQB99273.1 methyltransferase [Pedobacter sp. Hv1]
MDVFGLALSDFYKNGNADILWLYNSYDEPEEMPIDIFFRDGEEMPDLEHKALTLCYGKTLDVGAGVGSHALLLQEMGVDVTAIDISAPAVKIMQQRGVKKAFEQDIFLATDKYDTLLFLMNGIGLTGTLAGFANFLEKAKKLIHPDGQLIFDSSDISYLYEGLPKPVNKYFGEVSYRYEYQQQKGNWFDWLYLDQETLIRTANQQGWQCGIVFDDGEDQYLARLFLAE